MEVATVPSSAIEPKWIQGGSPGEKISRSVENHVDAEVFCGCCGVCTRLLDLQEQVSHLHDLQTMQMRKADERHTELVELMRFSTMGQLGANYSQVNLHGKMQEEAWPPVKQHEMAMGVFESDDKPKADIDLEPPTPKTPKSKSEVNWESASIESEAKTKADLDRVETQSSKTRRSMLTREPLGFTNLHRFKLADILSLAHFQQVAQDAVTFAFFEQGAREAVGEDGDQDLSWNQLLRVEATTTKLCNYIVLSPGSKRRLFWDLLSMLFIFYDIIFLPLQLCFSSLESDILESLDLCTLCYWSLDIVITFFTGYYASDGLLVMMPEKIAIKYLTSWFTVDFLILSFDWVGQVMEQMVAHGGGSPSNVFDGLGAMRMYRVLRFTRLLRLARMRKLQHMWLTFLDTADSEYVNTIMSVVKYVLVVLIINHFLACIFFMIGTTSVVGYESWVSHYLLIGSTIEHQYLASFLFAIKHFTLTGTQVHPQNVPEQIFALSLAVTGMVAFAVFVSNITSSLTHIRQLRVQLDRQCWLLRKYLHEQRVSRILFSRINRYATFIVSAQSNRVQQKDVPLLTQLSRPLQIELQTELYQPRLLQHPLFTSLRTESVDMIRKLCCACITQEMVSTGDVVFRFDEMCEVMYFVMRGTLDYRHKALQELDQTVETQFWSCEASLWTQWKNCGVMRAVEPSDLLKVHAEMFQDLLLQYPKLRNVWFQYADNFIGKMNDLVEKGTLSDVLQTVRYPYLNLGKGAS